MPQHFQANGRKVQRSGHDFFILDHNVVRSQKHPLHSSPVQSGHYICACYFTITNNSTGSQFQSTQSLSLGLSIPPQIKTSLFIRETEYICFQNGSICYLIALTGPCREALGVQSTQNPTASSAEIWF
jgi:hypothetical protein